jgi:cytochrome c556
MKIRLLLIAVVCALTPGRAIFAADEPETELGAKMEKVGGAFRALGRQITDASKNADSLQRLAVIKENLTAGLKLEPAKKAEIPAADQKKFVADYRAEMKKFLELVEKTEAALKANNNAEAEKLVATMRDDQKKAHKQFKKDDKKKK